MNLTYIPRSQLREALLAGHRLVPGHEYRPGDWASSCRSRKASACLSTSSITCPIGSLASR